MLINEAPQLHQPIGRLAHGKRLFFPVHDPTLVLCHRGPTARLGQIPGHPLERLVYRGVVTYIRPGSRSP